MSINQIYNIGICISLFINVCKSHWNCLDSGKFGKFQNGFLNELVGDPRDKIIDSTYLNCS